MKAIDANVLLRLIVGDDPKQEATARALIARERVLVPLTVTLECEWVLRSYYKWPRAKIVAALDEMTGVEHLVFEHRRDVRWALGRLGAGADFSDMIHIVQAAKAGASNFATFDTGIAGRVGDMPPIPAITLA